MKLKSLAKLFLKKIQINPSILKFNFDLAIRSSLSQALPKLDLELNEDEVTLIIVNYETKYSTELTLRTLYSTSCHTNISVWVIDNGSSDGSLDHLKNVQKDLDFEIIKSDESHPHSYWLNYAFSNVQTDLWFAVDSDMLFLSKGWLSDMIKRFREEPDLYLLSAEPKQKSVGPEPVGGTVVESQEAPSTWLFGMRTKLRSNLQTPFDFTKGRINPETGNLVVYDTGLIRPLVKSKGV